MASSNNCGLLSQPEQTFALLTTLDIQQSTQLPLTHRVREVPRVPLVYSRVRMTLLQPHK
jgi:hypothetical protein